VLQGQRDAIIDDRSESRVVGVTDQTSGRPSPVEALDTASISDDSATVIAAGVLAASLAAICHETVGHGLGCVGIGGRITLLTSIWFQCRGATSLTDAAGPIASLVGGVAAIVLLSFKIPNGAARLTLILFGAFGLFWFAGQLIGHALVNGDDWAFIAGRMGWSWVWRPIAAAIGVAAYAVAMRLMLVVLRRNGAPRRQAIRLAYAAAVASAIIAGLMWSAAPIRSAREAFLTLGIAPLGLLVAAEWASRNAGGITADTPPLRFPILRSWI